MKRKFKLPLLIGAALILGLAGSELLCRSTLFRDLAGRIAGRGRLVTITNGHGIYETDLGGDEEVSAADLIAPLNLDRASANEVVDWARVDREVALLKAQFVDEKAFQRAVQTSGFSVPSLRNKVAIQLRARDWLEKQIAPRAIVTEPECRQFYDAHRDLFLQPVRFRASHIFLAAHAETPPEVVEEKEAAIAALSERLTKGESFSQLAAEASEDEATKSRSGDLGYFSESRMPPEFIAEIRKLRVGETSKPFRSHLGFHIAQVTEIKDPRFLSFEEARPEISIAMRNDRRAASIGQIAKDISASN
jgi:parvulin-like peptidyl-prolyl isomerase